MAGKTKKMKIKRLAAEARVKRSGAQKLASHVRAQGQRKQARRDSRQRSR